MQRRFNSDSIASAVNREANTKSDNELECFKNLKKVFDNQSGLMYDSRVASEKDLTKLLIRSRTELLPVRVPKYQKNRIYDNLTEMQP